MKTIKDYKMPKKFGLLIIGGLVLLMSVDTDALAQYGPGDWQLPADYYVPAKMDMTITHPRTEASSWAYSKNAHPGVRWEIPIVIQGGAWPFRYEIVEDDGATGLEIGEELERSSENGFIVHRATEEYGVLWWDDPVEGEYEILVRVHDQDSNSIDVPVLLTVGTDGWIFVDADNGDDENDGSINTPFETIDRIHDGGSAFSEHRVYLSGVVPMDGNATGGNLSINDGAGFPAPKVWVGLPDSDAVFEVYEGRISLTAPDFYMANLEHRHHEDYFQDEGNYIHMITVWANTDRLVLHDVNFSRFQGNPVNTSFGNSSIIMFTDQGTSRDHVAVVNNIISGNNGPFTSAYQLHYSVFEKNRAVEANFITAEASVWAVFYMKRTNEYITLRANEFWDNNTWGTPGNLSGAMGLGQSRNIEFAYNTIETPGGVWDSDAHRRGAMKLFTLASNPGYIWTEDTPVWLYRNSLKRRINYEGENLNNMPDENVITERNVLDTGIWPTHDFLLNIENLDDATYFDSQMLLTGTARDNYLGQYGAEIAVEENGSTGPGPSEDQRIFASNRSEYIFSEEDFGIEEDEFSVKIETLLGEGELLLDGNPVSEGEMISPGMLNAGELSWDPPSGEHGYQYASFEFSLVDPDEIPPPPPPPGTEDPSDPESGEIFTMVIDLAASAMELNGGQGWRFLTGPATGETYASLLAPLWTQGVPGSDNPGATSANVLGFDQPTFWWADISAMDQPIGQGEAFIVYVLSDEDNDGNPDGFPKTLESLEEWAPLDGSFTYSGLDYDPDPEGINPNNVYLVGNPHPVSVDFCGMFEGATNVGSSNWIWNPAAGGGNGDYQNLNCATEQEVPIAPFQGFWVRTTGASPALGVPEEAYIGHTEEGLFKQNLKQEEAPLHIVLDVRSEDEVFANQVNILFSGEGTLGMDRFDAPKLSASGLADRWLSFYALDEQGRAYSFRSLPREFGEQISIPLDVETTEGGAFTLSWDLPDGVETTYWLRDSHTNQVTELAEGGKYRFEVEPTAEAGKQSAGELAKAVSMGKSPSDSDVRFELVVARAGVDDPGSLGDLPDQIRLQQNYPNPFNPTTVIRYELPQQSQVHLDVYDITGRHVATLVDGAVSAAGRHQVGFDASNLSSGVYIYRLVTAEQTFTRKLTVIK